MRACVAAVMFVLTAAGAKTFAFPVEKYAVNSALSTGRWVKVSVPESGLYAITAAQLRQWGFSDPSRVRVCGYGGVRIPDAMTSTNYIDDVPPVPLFTTSDGSLVFYGAGPETWAASITGRYSATSNLYTTKGYYFITEVAPGDTLLNVPEVELSGRPTVSGESTKSFWNRLQHEQDLVSPGQAGPHLVGENFVLTPTRTFTFDLPDRIADDKTGVWFETSFVAKTFSQSSTLTFVANGAEVPAVSADRVPATVNDEHYHGSETITRHILENFKDDKLELRVTHTSPVSVHGAWLNYISVNYQRNLQLDQNGYLKFWSNSTALSLGKASASTVILDVTTPSSIYTVDASQLTADGRREWTSSYTGWRTYVAFDDNAKLPSPTFEEVVANQDIHASLASGEIPDMIIVCNSSMMTQAARIAELHARDTDHPLKVAVYDTEKIYNEFSSGMADVSGLRKFFKMAWDMGRDSAPEGYESKFRYVILLGRATYDNRHLTEAVRAFNTNTIPNWVGGTMRQSLNDTDGYGTDDFLAQLKDGSGNDKGLDDLSIAIGRIPARTPDEAATYIDKLEQYMFSTKKNGWKVSAMFLADDGDSGRHMDQTESMLGYMSEIEDNPLFVNKVYIDAYTRESGVYPGAREAMFRHLDEGVVWWNYIGHANDHALTHNGQLTYNDINKMFYKNFPVFYGATCDFLRWDQTSLSGGEILLYERYGGAISVISATRPVYIYENGLLSNAFGRFLGARDVDGSLLTVGEIYRRAKNNILTDKGQHLTNPNRLKFVLMGDPAMRLATPSDVAVIEDIGGKALGLPDDPVELHALENTTVSGYIRGSDGTVRYDFNGIITLTLYDAEYSTTTHGNPDNNTEGREVTFEQQGARLSAASAPVTNGRFSVKLSVPVDIADNYRPAAITLYAYSTDNADEAAGLTRDLYVYGFDDNADIDDIPPVIESMYLNHDSFVDGGTVDSSPMLVAKVSDDVAINLSSAGVGHSMFIQLDGNRSYNDVSLYYTPSTDGTPSGSINYPFEDLTPGKHTLTLRVWDTSANATTASLSFTVGTRIAPKIYDIYTDANPAHDKANFYLTHDRPDRMATVTIEVFNLNGTPVWSKTVTGQSDMFTSTPVTWNLTDKVGRRVPRGIYLYRATITTDSETFDTGSRRIAVAAQ